MTTTDVCEAIVKPATLACKSSYCDMMVDQGHGSVGTAVVFISHAWKYKFLDVVDALKSHFKATPDIIVWFDLFSNNQHKAVSLDFDWWCGVFMSAIADFRHVVMLLSPWGDPISLKRAWCLFEAYCSAKTKCKFEVALSGDEKQQFIEAVIADAEKHVNNMLSKIDCEQSECYKPDDRDKIFDVVRREVSFGKINSMVFEQLRSWVLQVTSEELEVSKLLACSGSSVSNSGGGGGGSVNSNVNKSSEFIRFLSLENALGDLYKLQGLYKEAESSYKHCLEARTVTLGQEDAATLQSLRNLSSIYKSQGKYTEAETLGKECLEKSTLYLTESHEDTLKSMYKYVYIQTNFSLLNLPSLNIEPSAFVSTK